MDEKQKQIEDLKQKIQTAEEDLNAAKRALFELTGDSRGPVATQPSADGGEIVEGRFNGENMVANSGKTYPVPANYASKSKLVEGDILKLTITKDGSFVFKQIQPVERERAVATLGFADNAYHATYNNKNYNILYASVTYHKAKPGDKVAIDIPNNGTGSWAALENVLHNQEEEDRFIEETKHEAQEVKESQLEEKPLGDVEFEQQAVSTQESAQEKQETEAVVPEATSEKVINPLPAEPLQPEKPDVLGVSEIEIEPPKTATPAATQPEPPTQQPPQQVHPLEREEQGAKQQEVQPEQPVQEMEI